VKKAGRLAALAILALALSRARAEDGFKRLESDLSPHASRTLSQLYFKTKSADQRFWVVQAMGVRLAGGADDTILEGLLAAAEDKEIRVRVLALRALIGFRALPKNKIDPQWLKPLEAAAAKAVKDKQAQVRDQGLQLEVALRVWRRDPELSAKRSSSISGVPGVIDAMLPSFGWLWSLVIPLAVFVWAKLGLPVFDASHEEGRAAQRAWRVLRSRIPYAVLGAWCWLQVAGILANSGFDVLTRFLGGRLYGPSKGMFAALFAAAVCFFIPGGSCAELISNRPSDSDPMGFLRALPKIITAALLAAFVLVPLEAIYRIFIRAGVSSTEGSSNFARRSLRWTLETGAFRSCALALAISSEKQEGLIPAWRRTMEIFPEGSPVLHPRLGLGAFDSRFAWLAVSPALGFFCVMSVQREPVEWRASIPVILLGCSAWAWVVLSGVLFSVLQTLEGVLAADAACTALGRPRPEGITTEGLP